MDVSVFLQQEEKPKSADEIYSAFASAFQDLRTLSPEHNSAYLTPGIVRNLAVTTLPQRIAEWFSWQNGRPNSIFHESDWSSPLDCIANLQPHYSYISEGDASPYLLQNTSENILSESQKHDLFRLDWLCFALPEAARDPLLNFVCCTLAARHLPEDIREPFLSRLHAVTEETIKTVILSSQHFSSSTSTIKALYIWAAWLPITGCRHGHSSQDPRFVLSSALDMGRHLGLNVCAQRLLEVRNLQAAGHPVDANLTAELLDKTRLVSYQQCCCCLELINVVVMYGEPGQHVTSAHPVLRFLANDCLELPRYSLGTGGFSHSSHGAGFVFVFPATCTVPMDFDGCQDARIRIVSDLLHVTETALGIQPRSNRSTDLESWFRERRGHAVLMNSPLALAGFVQPQFSEMRGVLSRALQLLVYYDVLYRARKLYETSSRHRANPNNPVWCLEVGSDSSLVHWMKDGLVLAEEILVWAVQVDSDFLAVLPDHLFLFFSFAAVYIIGVKLVVFNALRTVIPSVDRQLLHHATVNLKCAALWPGHPAKSCAEFITTLLLLWDSRTVLFAGEDEVN
ncbi:hypothetical protein WG66_009761 [Moniliophthora roreri]|nr:hypothetical protein WG66_009761 [Moniliophthora roreri]